MRSRLNFNGPASKLTLAYRSDPPLPANDIITAAGAWATSSEATTRKRRHVAERKRRVPQQILSEAISSQLGGRLERLFGITRFRVDPGLAGVGSTGSEQNAAARVTVEQQIARNLTITYVSNVSSNAAAGHSSGIQRGPKRFHCRTARPKRNVWYRHKNQKALPVNGKRFLN